MKQIRKLTPSALAFFLVFATSSAFAQSARDIALLFKSTGTVEIKGQNDQNWQTGKRGNRLNAGDDLRTGQNSLAALVFTDDKSLMRVWKNSSVRIEGEREKNTIKKRVRMEFGQFFVNAKKQKSSFIVETPSGVAAIRGTGVYFKEDNGLEIICVTGLVDAARSLAELIQGQVVQVSAGNTGTIVNGQIQVVPTEEVPDFGQVEGAQEYRIGFKSSTGGQSDLVITVVEQ